MKKIIFLFVFLMPLLAYAQDSGDEVVKQARFPGGDKEFTKFLSANLKYPKKPLRKNIEGTVYIRFIVDKDGSVNKDSVKIVLSVDDDLDAEAVRVVKLSPKWTPAMKNNVPVGQRIRVPIKFAIAKPTKKPKKPKK